MITEELQKAINSKDSQVLAATPIPETEDPIDEQAKPSLEEFMATLMMLRNMRLGRLAIVKLPAAANGITAKFKPTRFLRAYFLVKGKSATTPVYVQFNGDTGTNYCYPSNPSVSKIILSGADTTSDERGLLDFVSNEAGVSKSFFSTVQRWNGSAASAPTLVTNAGGWENTTSQITSLKLLPAGSETFAAGSYLIVYGTD